MDSAKESAFMRSVRMRRAGDALYWAMQLVDSGYSGVRISKLLFKLAVRDNLSIKAMLAAEAHMANPGPERSAVILQLASSHKLWSTEYGRKLAQLICAVQDDCSYRPYTDPELLLQLDTALGDDALFSRVVLIVHEILARAKRFQVSPYADFLKLLDGQVAARFFGPDDEEVEAALGFLKRVPGGAIEEPLVYLVVTWLVAGVFGQDVLPEPPDVLVSVAQRLRSDPESKPLWASSEDRRFESSWDGYTNMSLMFERHGRLDPDDAGVLFLTKDGKWTPVIREEEGVLLVQSQKFPRTFYEVNLAILSCTCQDFIRRSQPCKHVDAAQEYWDAQCPFVVEP